MNHLQSSKRWLTLPQNSHDQKQNIGKNATKLKSHRRSYLAESDWVSLSFFWFHRERDTRPLCLCDDGGVWGLEIKQMEGEGEALDRRSKLGEWGLRLDRWRVRVRVRAWDRRWRVRVEIKEMEGEGEAWDRRSKLGEWGLRLDRWRLRVSVRAWDRRWRVRVEIGEMEGDRRSSSWEREADVWERLGLKIS